MVYDIAIPTAMSSPHNEDAKACYRGTIPPPAVTKVPRDP